MKRILLDVVYGFFFF